MGPYAGIVAAVIFGGLVVAILGVAAVSVLPSVVGWGAVKLLHFIDPSASVADFSYQGVGVHGDMVAVSAPDIGGWDEWVASERTKSDYISRANPSQSYIDDTSRNWDEDIGPEDLPELEMTPEERRRSA